MTTPDRIAHLLDGIEEIHERMELLNEAFAQMKAEMKRRSDLLAELIDENRERNRMVDSLVSFMQSESDDWWRNGDASPLGDPE